MKPRERPAARWHVRALARRRACRTAGAACAAAAGRRAAARSLPDDRFAGLQWRFVRIKYHYIDRGHARSRRTSTASRGTSTRPAAEQNLSRRLKTATAIQVEDPIVLTLDDPRLFNYPWIYIVEPGNLKLTDSDVPTLREFLLRGGTLTFDDFHGPIEWDHIAAEMKRVFPDREIVDYPEGSSGLQLLLQARRLPAGRRPRLVPRRPQLGEGRLRRPPAHDPRRHGRPMVFINWNTDMGDGWEWSNAEEYPGYIKYTSLAYRMGINEIVYALTH